MGPKLGFTNKDNGWLSFNNVRIPRENMLQKYVSVDREGGFGIEGDLRVMFSTMMSVRMLIIEGSSWDLSRGLVIAMRYSFVRRQFRNTAGSKEETQLIDYQTQQMKLFPLVAQCHMMAFTARYIHREYDLMMEEIKNDEFGKMDLLHHLLSGYKSLFSQKTYDGLIQIRQSIGGAGYSAWSGLP